MTPQPSTNYQVMPPTSSVPGPSTPTGPKRSGIRVIIMIIILLVIVGGAAYYFLVYSKDDTKKNLNNTVAVVNSNSGVNANVSNTNVNITANTNNNSNQNFNSAVNLNANTISASNLNTSIINNNSESSEPATKIVDGQTVDWLDYLLGDEDGDTVDNGVERTYGTNIRLKDTDGDGFDDNVEIGSCYNPVSSGKMDGNYFSDIYCVIDSSQIVDALGESLEQKNALIQKHNDLCKDWTLFADEVMTSKIAGENIGLLFTLANENYNESCKKMQDKYNNGQLDDVIKKFAFSASNAEDLCDEFSYKIRFMCGEETGY